MKTVIDELYPKYADQLKAIKDGMREMISNPAFDMKPQYDDIEAEITCMLIMQKQAKYVVEFSPCNGWSTAYMLRTLNVIGGDAELHSYDINDHAQANISQLDADLKDRWHFHLGDVQNEFSKMPLDRIDYLFIDSDHSREFAKQYVDLLLRPLLAHLRESKRSIPVSVHDVYHNVNLSDEGCVVAEFLKENGITSFSPSMYLETADVFKQTRQACGLDDSLVHYAVTNPCMFFILG